MSVHKYCIKSYGLNLQLLIHGMGISAKKFFTYMAVMIPDRIPSRASAGEKKVFSVLQRLDDDHVVYYEPLIEDRYPDFVLISPVLGLMVIEVKGWYVKDIVGGDTNNIQVKEKSGVVVRSHPNRQARNYMFDLMNRCQNSTSIRRLIQEIGSHENKFVCPMS